MNIRELITPPNHEITASKFLFTVKSLDIDFPLGVTVVAINWGDEWQAGLAQELLNEDTDPSLRRELSGKLYSLEVRSVDQTLVLMAISSPNEEELLEALSVIKPYWEELGGFPVVNLDEDSDPASINQILEGTFFNTVEDCWSVITFLIFADTELNPN